jgi:hypothetical protein
MPMKADYVRDQSARPHGGHHCHWPGCGRDVPPAKWGCTKHWYALPIELRRQVWRTFEPGQEVSKRPSAEYLTVAREVQDWIAANHPPAAPAPDLFAEADSATPRRGEYPSDENPWTHADGRED